jgi:hypothetical protein
VGHALLYGDRRDGVAARQAHLVLSIVADYAILVDGQRVDRARSEDDVRAWLAKYREDHPEDDPDAAHVQVLERGVFSWLTGGKLLDRKRFL